LEFARLHIARWRLEQEQTVDGRHWDRWPVPDGLLFGHFLIVMGLQDVTGDKHGGLVSLVPFNSDKLFVYHPTTNEKTKDR